MPKNKICRTELPNGCSVSQVSVIPKNWKQAKKITGPWRIFYTFYDPVNGKKQVSDKKVNQFHDIAERRHQTQEALDIIMMGLKQGYNPFYKKVVKAHQVKYDIEPNTLLIPALKIALERVKLDDDYRKHIGKYVIPNIEKAAVHLGYHVLFISEVRRKHIIFMLDHLAEVNPRFSDNTFNRFRTDLKILFKALAQIEVIEHNPIDDNFPKKQLEEKEKIVLSPAERKYINDLLLREYPSFHRFLHIFFHSGARSKELLRLKGSDVELSAQRFRVVIKKGNKYRTTWKVIKNIAMPYWVEQMKNCSPGDFVFSNGLNPGEKQIAAKQITRRWYSLIKKRFVYNAGRKSGKGVYVDRIHVIDGRETTISADWYSLKHLQTTEMVDHLNEQAAAALNGHTSTQMVAKVYDLKHKERIDEKLKRVNNKFA